MKRSFKIRFYYLEKLDNELNNAHLTS